MVRLWDASTGKLLALPLPHEYNFFALTFSLDSKMVATGSVDHTVLIREARTGRPLAPPLPHEDIVAALAFSLDGQILATGSSNGMVRLWAGHTGKLLGRPLKHPGSVKVIAFSPNGKNFFVATDHWLTSYSWDGKSAVPQGSQLLHGFWKGGFRFSSDCESCVQVAMGDTGNSSHLETLRLDEPTDPPIEGDPKELLEKWQARLGLKFDEQMRLVPR
jgi:WD40 repeat protein